MDQKLSKKTGKPIRPKFSETSKAANVKQIVTSTSSTTSAASTTSSASTTATKTLFPTIVTKDGCVKKILPTNNSTELIKPIPSKTIDKNIEEICDAVKQLDSTCDFMKCKTKVNLIGETCKVCQNRFCFKHNLPEIHGCGEGIKKAERDEFLHPRPIQTVRREKETAKVQARFKQTLKDMEQNRKAKTPTLKPPANRNKP